MASHRADGSTFIGRGVLLLRLVMLSTVGFSLVAGCGDPGLPSSGVALVSGFDGARSVRAETCGPPARIEFSPGVDPWADPTITLRFSDVATTSHTVDLRDAAASGTFVYGDQDELDDLGAPFSVRLSAEDGTTWAVVSFSDFPAEGTAALVVKEGDSATTVVDSTEVGRFLDPAC